MNDQTHAPTATVSQADLATPHAYVIMRHTQLCKCCNKTSEYSKTYAKTNLRSTLGNKIVVHYRRLDTPPKWDLPIIIQNAEPEILEFCHQCYHPTLHDLPKPPCQGPVVAPSWIGTQTAQPEAKRQSSTTARTPRIKSVDDLAALAGL